MSISSRAYRLLCRLYGFVLREMRLGEFRAERHLPVKVAAAPIAEQLEPRVFLDGNPGLDISAAVDHGFAGSAYTLSATATTASGDPEDEIAKWIIDWGDGGDVEEFVTNELAPVMTHAYVDDFAYDITVVVEDAEGDQNVVGEPADNIVEVAIMEENVAQGKSASQSSNYPGQDAANAVDGDTDGLLANAAMTTEDVNPWWQVDLGGTHDIGRLNIWNVEGAEAGVQTDFWVFVGSSDLSAYTLEDLTAEEQPDYVTWRLQIPGQAGRPETMELPDGIDGQYVRVQLAGEDRLDRLHLAEVEVIGLSHFRAVDDSDTTTDQDTPVDVAAPGVLNNDYRYDFTETIEVSDISSASSGEVTAWDADGSFSYDPEGLFDHVAQGETDTATFQYLLENSQGQTSVATVSIEITGINDDPVATDSTFIIKEYAANDSAVGTAVANDVDTGDALTYTITAGNEDGVFAIDAATGEITVADNSTLDAVATPSYELTVEIEDPHLATDTATVTVNVTDNFPPVVDDDTFLVRDNAPDDTFVGTVTASDPDPDETLAYAITGGDTENAFKINSETGEIQVNDRTKLDVETTPTYLLEVTVTDSHTGETAATITVNVSGQNDAPVISIANQTMSYTQVDPLDVPLPTTDAEGDPITYSNDDVTIRAYSPAYDLKTELGLAQYFPQHDNYLGAGRKYMLSDVGIWYYILPGGQVRQYATDELKGTIDAEYHTDPDALINLVQPVVPNVTHEIADHTLSITLQEADYTGTFLVEVIGNDGKSNGTGSFTVTVVNNAPPINNIENQTIKHNADPMEVEVVLGPNEDADGEAVTFDCTATDTSVEAAAYALKTELGLATYLPQFDNYNGQGEKWLQNADGQYLYILPNGEVYQYMVAEKKGDVDTTYYDDPQSLIDLVEPAGPDATFTYDDVDVEGVLNRQVTIAVGNADFEGTFSVEATATDDVADEERTVTEVFTVTVVNSAPVINEIADQDLSAADAPVDIELGEATDDDGEAVVFTYALQDYQPAFDLKTQLGLAQYFPQYDNYGGIERKFMQANDATWYCILPSGAVHRYDTGELMGQVGTEYYDNPQDLIDATPNPAPPDNFIAVVDTTMTITPADVDAEGTFTVEITATDAGGKTSTHAFQVSIIDHAPVINEVADQTISYRDDPRQAVVILGPTTDADGQAVTYVAEVVNTSAEAWQLREDLGLTTYLPQFDNAHGRGEKWFQNAAGTYYYILDTGEVFQYLVAAVKGQIDTAYYDDPQSLIDLEETADPNVITGLADVVDGEVTNRQLTVTVQNANYLGTFRVDITASSGVGDDEKTSTYSFDVTVKNSEPVWQTTPGNQVIYSYATNSTTVTYLATDADAADSVIYSASVNTTKAAAYELASRLMLTQYLPQYDNMGWHMNEKWYYSDNTGMYYGLLPDGIMLQHYGGGIVVGQIDPSYHEDPWSLLYESQIYAPEGVQLTWIGNELTVTAPDGFTGRFQVDVEATDGENTITHSFTVTVY